MVTFIAKERLFLILLLMYMISRLFVSVTELVDLHGARKQLQNLYMLQE